MSFLIDIAVDDLPKIKGVKQAYKEVEVPKKDGTTRKVKEPYYFNLLVDELGNGVSLKQEDYPTIMFITAKSVETVPSGFEERVFLSLNLDDEVSIPNNVYGLVDLSKDSTWLDSDEPYKLLTFNSRVRYIGAKLFNISGLGVGRLDSGVAKELGIKGKEVEVALYEDKWDVFTELGNIPLDGITLVKNTPKASKPRPVKPKGVSTKTPKEKKPKPPTKAEVRKNAFNSVFGGGVSF